MKRKLSAKQQAQLDASRENRGDAATERQLAEARRCTLCFGRLPGGHARGCRYYRSGQGGGDA